MNTGRNFRDRILTTLDSHPLSLLLFLLLMVSAYGNYYQAKQLDQVCELSGPHGDVVASPKTDREKLDNICSARDEDDDGDDDDNDDNPAANTNPDATPQVSPNTNANPAPANPMSAPK